MTSMNMTPIMIKTSSIENKIAAKPSIRYSNIELLRIVAMLLIMFGHFYLRIHPLPDSGDIINSPLSSFLDVILNCFATIGVSVFIAISGWFGIRFKKQGLSKYLFQVFFILWLVYVIALIRQTADININGIKISLCFYSGYWFVLGYLGLYLISPLLNSFIDYATKKELHFVLLSYFFFQSYVSWLSGWYNYYNGYSIILFAGIYLSSAYFRKYPIKWVENNAPLLFFTTIISMAIIVYFSMMIFGFAGRQLRDDNPLAIFSSIMLVITFKKMKFQTKFVNWLAASCFSVYLIHYSPFVYPYIMQLMNNIYMNFDGLLFGLVFLTSLMLIYVFCTMIDQIRVLNWKLIQYILGK